MSLKPDLKDIFDSVSDWLKFAEAKNAAILALGGLFFSAILSISIADNSLLAIYFWMAIAFLSISGFLAICSFIPQLRIPMLLLKPIDENPDARVPIYFSDIGASNLEDYQMMIADALEIETLSVMDMHYIQQIHTNSRIAARKFAFFNISVWFLVAAIFTPVGVLALLIMKKNGEI